MFFFLKMYLTYLTKEKDMHIHIYGRLISEYESWFSRTLAGVELGFLYFKTMKLINENKKNALYRN